MAAGQVSILGKPGVVKERCGEGVRCGPSRDLLNSLSLPCSSAYVLASVHWPLPPPLLPPQPAPPLPAGQP
ncbi:rCG45357, partial [Rattus norvegicus]